MNKILSILLVAQALYSVCGVYTPLTVNDTAFLFLDLQTGLFNGVQDQPAVDLMNNIEALADLAVLFNVPVVLTTSHDTGPNGPIIPYLVTKFPNVQIIHRPGQINAFDDDEFA